MILILSIIGIFGLLFLEYYIYKRDNSNIKIRQFISVISFLKVLNKTDYYSTWCNNSD